MADRRRPKIYVLTEESRPRHEGSREDPTVMVPWSNILVVDVDIDNVFEYANWLIEMDRTKAGGYEKGSAFHQCATSLELSEMVRTDILRLWRFLFREVVGFPDEFNQWTQLEGDGSSTVGVGSLPPYIHTPTPKRERLLETAEIIMDMAVEPDGGV